MMRSVLAPPRYYGSPRREAARRAAFPCPQGRRKKPRRKHAEPPCFRWLPPRARPSSRCFEPREDRQDAVSRVSTRLKENQHTWRERHLQKDYPYLSTWAPPT